MPSPQSKNWHVTINGDEDTLLDSFNYIVSLPYGPDQDILAIAGQPERGSSLHLQLFVQFNRKKAMPSVKRLLPAGAHVEIMRSSVNESLAYVTKDDTYDDSHEVMIRFHHGDFNTQGRRYDLEDISNALVNRETTVTQIATDAPSQFVRYFKGLQALQDQIAVPYSGGEKEIHVYYGPTGTGKTRKAFAENPDAYFWGPELGKWFQGYKSEEVTILDEFRGQLPFGFLLRLMDRYPMQVESKGSSTHFVSSKIIVCSPVHPKLWYLSLAQSEGKYDQLMRRITSVVWFGEDPEPPVPDLSPDLSAQFM